MSRRQVVVVTTLPMLLFLGLVVVNPARAGENDDDAAAVSVLQRAVTAAGVVAFTGVQVISTVTAAGTTTRMVDIRSEGDGRRWVSVRQAGRAGASAQVWAAGPADEGVDPLAVLAGAYRLASAGADEVAGHRADVVTARRAGQVAARLWVDSRTGLLLREEVYDASGAMTRMSAFVEVRTRPSVASVASAVPRQAAPASAAAGLGPTAVGVAARTDQTIDAAAVAALRRRSAPCPLTLPGGLVLIDARTSSTADAVHLTYSDGLSGLSLFVQSGRLGELPGAVVQDWSGAQVHVAAGWPTRLVWQGGSLVFTLVTDAPLDEQRAVVAALPHQGADGSLLARFGQGVQAALDLLPGHHG